MNFFERQEVARRQSRRLVLLFALAVLGIVAAINLALMLYFGAAVEPGQPGPGAGPFVFATLATVAVIGMASLFRIAGLRSGGGAVARQLGGVHVAEDTTDPGYRRLRNVVEEIAIASSVPVPEIYVLESEPGINAFAAGWSTSDAAVAVTRGALDRLNRDELQGVIAHEFSHVLNGDMRLNIRLMGVLFGILMLALIGQRVLVGARFGGGGRNNNAGAIMMIALGVMILGYIGLFFGRLIKAGVSRQREYLADASAVQFTRQSRGIAGALKKIGGLPDGSRIGNKGEAEEVSHMLFGDGVGLSSMFATHPPLIKRIQALEPDFKPDQLTELSKRWAKSPPSGLEEDRVMGLAGGGQPLPQMGSEIDVVATGLVAQVGTPESGHYQRAGSIVASIPAALREAASHSTDAPALVYALLFSAEPDVAAHQRTELVARHGEAEAERTSRWVEALQALHPMQRLPLAELAFPVLRRRPRPELSRVSETVHALVHADGRVSAFEYCLGRLLETQVHEALDPSRHWRAGRRKLSAARDEVALLFSLLALLGHEDEAGARRAFHAGMNRSLPHQHVDYAPPAQGILALDAVWPVLDGLEPTSKALLVEGMVEAISHDGHIGIGQAELLRTACAVLHCPVPPLLSPASAASA